MDIAALILWIITAAGGFYLLATWIGKGGLRQQDPSLSKFPPALIFGHFLLAVVGLIVWIIYLVADKQAWAWIAFILLLLIAALGFTMLLRWVPGYRNQAAAGSTGAVADRPAEQHFPVMVVGAHGLLAVGTLVLVLLAALEVGS
jgi:hypothetical protein